MDALTRRGLLMTAIGRRRGALGLQARPDVRPRETWAKDRPPTGPLVAENVKFFIVHHSASRVGHTGADVPEILRSFYDLHTGEKGWNDIAYNFLIDSEGGIWEGRAGSLVGPVAGDATGGNQGFSQLVCVIGDYDEAKPSDASLKSLVSLLAWLSERDGVPTSPGSTVSFTSRGSNLWPAGVGISTPTITGHRSMSRTRCPGQHLNAYVAGELMADVDAARAAPTTATSSTTSTTAPAATILPAPILSASAGTAEPPGGSGSRGAGLVITASAITSALAALLLWRHRRLRSHETSGRYRP